jgi:diadenosine tetraphosphate (Ap4A) HIT family hydrolase
MIGPPCSRHCFPTTRPTTVAPRYGLLVTESECVFCAIVDGASAHFVAETGLVIAFLDIAPMAPGHTLVVPRRHAPRLADLTADEMAALALIGQRIAIALGSEAHTLFLSDGAVAGQEVDHVHLHVVPRAAGDGVAMTATFGEPTAEELTAVARTLRSALDD